MNVRLGLLRKYLHEVLLVELSVDRNFVNHLKRASGLDQATAGAGTRAHSIAKEWLDDLEQDTGGRLHGSQRGQVIRFVNQRLPGLLGQTKRLIQAIN